MSGKTPFRFLTADYEVYGDDKSTSPIAKAAVSDGVIENLAIAEGADEDYPGQILSSLLISILKEADKINSNLSIQIAVEHNQRMSRFLERFGFRHIGENIYKRISGSVIPPRVHF